MRCSRAWLGLALALYAVPARANTVVQGMATVDGGYNSNPTGTAVARGDWFLDVRPGLRLTSMFERGLFFAQYTFDAMLYLNRSGTGFSNDLTLGAMLVTSRTTTLTLTAGVLQSQFNNLAALQTSTSAPLLLVPTGPQQFVSARAGENLQWDFTPTWHFGETSTFTALIPLSDNLRTAYDLNTILDVGKRWQRDALVLSLRLDWVDYPSTTPGGEVIGPQDQLLPAASARWLHDFGSFWSTELMAGVMFALRAAETPGLFIEPVARAAVHYRRQEGNVDLSYDHVAEPSLQSGFTLIGDTLALRGGVPLPARTHLLLAGSFVYQRGNLLDFGTGQSTGTTDAFLADVGLTWAPWREMSFFARYAFTDQIATASTASALPSFSRHLAIVGVTIVYPAEAVAPTSFRSTVRVDRSDVDELPALHAPPAPPAPPR